MWYLYEYVKLVDSVRVFSNPSPWCMTIFELYSVCIDCRLHMICREWWCHGSGFGIISPFAFTGHRWIPPLRVGNTELFYLLCCWPGKFVEKTVEVSEIWDAMWRHSKVYQRPPFTYSCHTCPSSRTRCHINKSSSFIRALYSPLLELPTVNGSHEPTACGRLPFQEPKVT